MSRRRVGRYELLHSQRSDERRQRSWAGIGPAWDDRDGAGREVVGVAVHAGRHLLVLLRDGRPAAASFTGGPLGWRHVLRRAPAKFWAAARNI